MGRTDPADSLQTHRTSAERPAVSPSPTPQPPWARRLRLTTDMGVGGGRFEVAQTSKRLVARSIVWACVPPAPVPTRPDLLSPPAGPCPSAGGGGGGVLGWHPGSPGLLLGLRAPQTLLPSLWGRGGADPHPQLARRIHKPCAPTFLGSVEAPQAGDTPTPHHHAAGSWFTPTHAPPRLGRRTRRGGAQRGDREEGDTGPSRLSLNIDPAVSFAHQAPGGRRWRASLGRQLFTL